MALDEALTDVERPGADRVLIAATFAGEHVGTLELPVCDGSVGAGVIADAAADLFGWELLRLSFEQELYPALRTDPSEWLARRALGDVIARADAEALGSSELHDRVGWGVFLQELWGSDEEPGGFYASAAPLSGMLPRVRAVLRRRRWHRVEVSSPLAPARGPADVVVAVGGAILGLVSVEHSGAVSPRQLRDAITARAGFELCRVAVREGLIGQPADGMSLRERLVRAASKRRTPTRAGARLEAPRSVAMAPGWEEEAAAEDGAAVLLSRHGADPALGTSASRRAAIPSEAAEDAILAVRIAGEPLVRVGTGGGGVKYTPELVWRRSRQWLARRRPPSRGPASCPADQSARRRHRFEAAFAAREDPWRYTNEYERSKYALTLSLLPERMPEAALEIGCAEGRFTELLAPRVGRLTAADISALAVERAARRCGSLGNVAFAQLDLVSDDLPGKFDLVVCSETLYFVGDRTGLAAAARKLADAVSPGGHLLTTNAHQVVDDPDSPGFDWGLPFGAQAIGDALESAGLSPIRDVRTPLYRVQLFRRTKPGEPEPTRELVELEQPASVPAHVADTVRWSGGAPSAAPEWDDAGTERLPILVYHRVVPDAGDSLYEMSSEAFEEQLDYMRSAGFQSVGLEEWRGAMEARRPLRDRAVMISFDDGYCDFAEHAWPLLRRYGFGAALFVVTDEVGRWNRWDEGRDDRTELMDWKDLVRLRDEGVELGSHSATHRRMGGMTPADVVREASRSRAALTRRLGRPPLAFAYPYGETDGIAQHLVGACGYRFGLTVRGVRCRLQDRLLAMPRIEVRGDAALTDFIASLNA